MTTRVAQLTPPGRAAVATLLVQGPSAIQWVARGLRPHSRSAWTNPVIGRIVVGRWSGLAAVDGGEEVVACRVAPESVEIHCHGGQAAIALILADLQELGARKVDWTETLDPAATSPTAAAATGMIPDALTERGALILLDQAAGALDRALAQIASSLKYQACTEALILVDLLLSRSGLGLHLTTPWQVTLAGPPNVGKSSLINALVGFQRTLVFDMPGTTRDVVSVGTAMQGWPIELSDTAGIQSTDEPLEAAGVQRALAQLERADLVIAVADGSAPRAARAEGWQQIAARTGCEPLRLVNKSDLLSGARDDDDDEVLFSSALTGHGIPELIRRIGDRLVPQPPPSGAAVPWQSGHVELLRRLRPLLAASASDDARALLSDWLANN